MISDRSEEGAAPAAPSAPAASAPAASVPALELRRAVLGYGDVHITRPIDLQVQPGEVVALLGENGCGKTTVVKGLLGLARIFEGEGLVFGRPVQDPTARARIGYVPQRIAAAGGLPVTVREAVAAGRVPRSRLLRPDRAADRAAVVAALDTVDLTDRAGSRLSLLSGGQQRRALIARALAGRPDALVMDEPMAGVDHVSQATLATTLTRLVGAGMTVLVVLHEVGPLRSLIDRVVAMEDGEVHYDGPPRDVDVHYHELVAHEHGDHPVPEPLRLPGPFSEA